MYIDDIFEKLLSGQNNSYSFETFILNLLKFHLKNQGKELSILDTPRTSTDAYVKDGFDDIRGNTLIDIKINLNRFPPKLFIERFIKLKSIGIQDTTFENYLIITSTEINESYRKRYFEEFDSIYKNSNIKLIIWGPREINKIAYNHRTESKRIVDNIFSLRIEQVIESDSKNWKEEREDIIANLIECFKNRQFSLFLGAGVSSSAGMPSWTNLLNSLFVSYLTNEFDKSKSVSSKEITEIVNRLNTIDHQSALMAARYLRKGLSKQQSNDETFISTITKSLYELRDKSKSENSELINAITNICMPRQNGARVKSLITYNFDDLLEKNLISKSIKFHSIYTENESANTEELPIYHVHGFLPEDRASYEGLDKTTLVFSEEGYHHIYSDPFHWSNLIQLYNLKENNCLMIGLSMTDPNLRRLLDISAKNIEFNRHFVFLKRLTIEEFAYEKIKFHDENNNISDGTVKIFKETKNVEEFLDRHHKLNEEIMKELCVNIIWYETHEDIPPILKRLNEL